jgi:hypothetical protein
MDENKDGSRELERDDLDIGDRATGVRDELGNMAGLANAMDEDVLENLMVTAE